MQTNQQQPRSHRATERKRDYEPGLHAAFHAFSRGGVCGAAGMLGGVLTGPVGGFIAMGLADWATRHKLKQFRENFPAFALGAIMGIGGISYAALKDAPPETVKIVSSSGLAVQAFRRL